MTDRNQTYRLDIDGLRAVAVGLVIAYHLWPAVLPSAYIGVDIFFVISGYVVTRSALPRLTGRPIADILGFWMRRVRRILPALIAAVVAGGLIAALFFPPYPTTLVQGSDRTGAAALLGLSNLYLLRADLDYFQRAYAQLNPFLHTWSLGVEEQFYVLFALVILPLAARPRLRLAILGLVFAASLILALTPVFGSMARFYLPLTRVWEIALGAGLGVLSLAAGGARLGGRRIVAVRGLALATLAGLAFVPHPGLTYPAWPVFGAAALTAVLVAIAPRTGGGLGAGPVAYLGRISYGLYLWHWVVLFAVDISIGRGVWFAPLMVVPLTVALAALSHRVIEAPFRDPRRVPAGKGLASVGVAMAGTLAMLFIFDRAPGVIYLGADRPWDAEWTPQARQPYAGGGRITHKDCHQHGRAAPVIPEACKSPAAASARRVLVLGDSHAYSAWPMLAAAEARGVGWIAYSRDGCALPGGGGEDPRGCDGYWGQAPDYIRAELRRGDVVYVSTYWKQYDDPADVDRGLQRLLAAAEAAGARLVVEGIKPVFPRVGFLCTDEWFRASPPGCTIPRAAVLKEAQAVRAYLDGLKREGRIAVFEPFDLLCPDDPCRALRGEAPIFRDQHHLSALGAASLGQLFADFLQTVPQT